jgi:hypothetical protein
MFCQKMTFFMATLQVRCSPAIRWEPTDGDQDIEQIEEPRDMNPDMDAVYVLTPLPHIVDCLLADMGKRKYRRSFLIWTSGTGDWLLRMEVC